MLAKVCNSCSLSISVQPRQPTKKRKAAPAPASESLKVKAEAAEGLKLDPRLNLDVLDLGGGSDGLGTLQLDGRASRTLTRLQTAISTFEVNMKALDLQDQPVSAQLSLKDYKAMCQKRVSSLTGWMKPAKDDIKKVERSTNKNCFADQLRSLEELVGIAGVLVKLLTLMPAQKPDPEEFLRLLEEFDKLNESSGLKLGLGPGFVLKSLMARANESCLHNDFSRFTGFFKTSSADVVALNKLMKAEDVQAHVVVEIENRLLSAMRAITPAELELKSSGKATPEDAPNMHEACSLASALVESAQGPDFLAKDVAASARVVYAMLDQQDIASLRESVQNIQSYSGKKPQEGQERAEELNAVVRFFLQHDVGKSVMGMAVQRLEHGEAEAEFQEICAHLENLIGCAEVQAKEFAEQNSSKGIAEVKQLVGPALSKLDELKACRFGKSKAAKKEGGAAGTIAELQKRLSEAASQLVTVELTFTLLEHLRLGCKLQE